MENMNTKWTSRFNNGDTVRHVTDIGEKGIITGVLFDLGSRPQYRISRGSSTSWWYEEECVRVIKGKVGNG